MKRFGAAVTAASLLVVLAATPAAATPPPYEQVATGLHSPRGLAFGPGGVLYVAEAGLAAGNPTDGIVPGVGMTGSITEIRDPGTHPSQRYLATGLLSVGDAEGTVGIDGISTLGNGGIYGIMALSSPGTGIPDGVGRLIKVSQGGEVRTVADVGGFNYAWSAAHADLSPRDFPDANPYAVLALPSRLYVADAGTNTLDEVTQSGTVRTLAFFPDNALADSTPTCVTQGPDGALYIGTLALTDSIVSGPSAKVYRVDLSQATGSESSVLGVATVWADGLWPMNGCAFGPGGTFYATELFTGVTMTPDGPVPAGGDVVKIPFAHPDQHVSLTGGTLPFPGGVAVAADGTVYAAAAATSADGFVVRLTGR